MPWTWLAIYCSAGLFGVWITRRHFRAVKARNAWLRWKLDERRGLR